MKRILLAVILVVCAIFAQAQSRNIKGYKVTALDTLQLGTHKLSNTTQLSTNDTIMATKDYVLSVVGAGNGWDSLTWNGTNGDIIWWYSGSKIDSMNTDDRYLQISDTTWVSQAELDSAINEASMKTVYTISLPYASTVAGRIAVAVEGTDYPTGWVLAAGSSPIDLDITHNLNRRVASVTVFAVTSTQEQQLFNTAAYNGIITPTVNSLRIQSLATVTKAIKIYIVFAQ